MKLFHAVALAASLGASSAHAQTGVDAPATLPAQTPASLLGASQFDMKSKIAGRTYRIFISIPTPPPPPEGYPVVYITDGNGLFGTAAMQMRLRQQRELRPAIIVGIGYPATDIMQPMLLRNRDLTPPTPADKIPAPMLQIAGGEAAFGGAEQFYRFLVDELRPALAATYRTNPKDQTLIGDSLGGLFTLHVLFNHPGSFRTYVAASPSIWWNGRAILAGEKEFAQKVTASEVSPRVLITVGALEQPPVPAGQAPKPDPYDAGRMIDNASELAGRLSALRGGPDYAVRYHVFPDETHASVIPGAISRGLSFALATRE